MAPSCASRNDIAFTLRPSCEFITLGIFILNIFLKYFRIYSILHRCGAHTHIALAMINHSECRLRALEFAWHWHSVHGRGGVWRCTSAHCQVVARDIINVLRLTRTAIIRSHFPRNWSKRSWECLGQNDDACNHLRQLSCSVTQLVYSSPHWMAYFPYIRRCGMLRTEKTSIQWQPQSSRVAIKENRFDEMNFERNELIQIAVIWISLTAACCHIDEQLKNISPDDDNAGPHCAPAN